MTTTTPAENAATKPPTGQILRLGGMATLVATAINLVLFLYGSTFSFPRIALTPMGVPVGLPAVAIFSLVAGIAATVGYLVLTRIFSAKTARTVMWVLTAVVLVLMAFTPLSISNAPVTEIVILEVMHLVAGLLPVWRLTSIQA